jgi:hypothetical protein
MMRSQLYAFTEHAQYWKAGKDGKPPELTNWAPDRRKIADLLEALSSIVSLFDDFEQPCWLDGDQQRAARCGVADPPSAYAGLLRACERAVCL